MPLRRSGRAGRKRGPTGKECEEASAHARVAAWAQKMQALEGGMTRLLRAACGAGLRAADTGA